MKKLYIIVSVSIASLSFAQVKSNFYVSQSEATDLTPFFDASSSTAWNDSNNNGKGLVFPRTDLTQLETIAGPSRPGDSNAPTRYDGMIVYNVGDGPPKIGKTETPNVTPGFYYYENKTNDLQGGHWVRFESSNGSKGTTRKMAEVEFTNKTYALIPTGTFDASDVFVNTYLINQATGEKVGSVKIEKNVQRDGETGDYVLSSNGSIYTVLSGKYKLVAEVQ